MLIKKASEILSSEITPQSLYMNRRKLSRGRGLACRSIRPGCEVLWTAVAQRDGFCQREAELQAGAVRHERRSRRPSTTSRTTTTITSSRTDKYEPAKLAASFNPSPWSVKVDGLVNKPKTFDLDTLMKMQLEERVYRMRCVEGWSMVIPWIGFPLKSLLDQVEPNCESQVRAVHHA